MKKQNYIFYQKKELYKKSGIYCIKNKVNNKIYVGKAKNLYDRLYSHLKLLKSNLHYNNHLQNSVNKYGLNNFKFIVLENCLINELFFKEHYWCIYYKSYKREFGYNLQITNPETNYTMSEETKKKIGLSNKGKKRTIKQKYNQSIIRQGMKMSDETKEKLRQINKNKVLSEEHKKKISISNKNRMFSDETKEKLKQLRKNPEAYIKIKLVENFTKKEFNSVKEACVYFNITAFALRNNLKNKGYYLNRFQFRKINN